VAKAANKICICATENYLPIALVLYCSNVGIWTFYRKEMFTVNVAHNIFVAKGVPLSQRGYILKKQTTNM